MKRTELEVQRAFHSYCIKVINNAGTSLYRKLRSRERKEVFFEDLPPNVQESISAIEDFVDEEREYNIGDYRFKESVVKEMLKEAIMMLPIEKYTTVVMYYYEEMLDREIAELIGSTRSTIQSRRASALKLLAKHLKEIAENYDDENGND